MRPSVNAIATANGTLNYLYADGSFSYTPNPTFTGTDSFSYEAYDGTFASSTVTVYIVVVDGTATLVAENDEAIGKACYLGCRRPRQHTGRLGRTLFKPPVWRKARTASGAPGRGWRVPRHTSAGIP